MYQRYSGGFQNYNFHKVSISAVRRVIYSTFGFCGSARGAETEVGSMEERVSVIIPTYNRPKWLPDTIESVLDQTYPQIEIIVVNDGSTDNTAEVLEPYRDRITYIYKENGGPGSAVSAGIKASTGKYISRVDDDDLFLPEKVESQVRMFQQNPELGLIATDHHIIDLEGKITRTVAVPDFSRRGAFLSLLLNCIFSQPTVMVRKECHDKVGFYKDTYAQDYDMWIRIARYYSVGVIHKPLAMYREHGSNRSGRSSNAKVKADIQSFVYEMMADISPEELVPTVDSALHAHDLMGAVYMRHDLYRQARDEFFKAVKAEPQDMIHRFWAGILLRSLGRHQDADEWFSRIAPEHELYDISPNAIELTSRMQTVDGEDEDALKQLRKDLSEEFKKVMEITIDRAVGRLK